MVYGAKDEVVDEAFFLYHRRLYDPLVVLLRKITIPGTVICYSSTWYIPGRCFEGHVYEL